MAMTLHCKGNDIALESRRGFIGQHKGEPDASQVRLYAIGTQVPTMVVARLSDGAETVG